MEEVINYIDQSLREVGVAVVGVGVVAGVGAPSAPTGGIQCFPRWGPWKIPAPQAPKVKTGKYRLGDGIWEMKEMQNIKRLIIPLLKGLPIIIISFFQERTIE